MPPEIFVCEFMDEAAAERLGEWHATLYDPALVDRPAELARNLQAARALIVRNRTEVSRTLLAAGPLLACVGRLGVGLDNIDLDARVERGRLPSIRRPVQTMLLSPNMSSRRPSSC